jgi:hypothetical protein
VGGRAAASANVLDPTESAVFLFLVSEDTFFFLTLFLLSPEITVRTSSISSAEVSATDRDVSLLDGTALLAAAGRAKAFGSRERITYRTSPILLRDGAFSTSIESRGRASGDIRQSFRRSSKALIIEGPISSTLVSRAERRVFSLPPSCGHGFDSDVKGSPS